MILKNFSARGMLLFKFILHFEFNNQNNFRQILTRLPESHTVFLDMENLSVSAIHYF